jgi:hypothetical protein
LGGTAREDTVMKMGEIEIHDYARQLLEAHGEMAVVEAVQKACSCEEGGQTERPKPGDTSKPFGHASISHPAAVISHR